MQIKIIGSHQCPDTLYALHVLAEKGYEVDFVDILGSHAGLKEYLTLRETDALYKDICGTQRLGIPCMILEDGTKTEMYPLYWTPSKEGTFCVIRLNLS